MSYYTLSVSGCQSKTTRNGQTSMKYTYETATGRVEIEVDNYWGEILVQADAEILKQHKKTYRKDRVWVTGKLSLETFDFEGELFSDPKALEAMSEVDLRSALEAALPKLSRRQQEVFRCLVYEGMNQKGCARKLGCPEPLVSRDRAIIAKKLQDINDCESYA